MTHPYQNNLSGELMQEYDSLPREVRDLYKEYDVADPEIPQEILLKIEELCGYVPYI